MDLDPQNNNFQSLNATKLDLLGCYFHCLSSRCLISSLEAKPPLLFYSSDKTHCRVFFPYYIFGL